MVLALTIKNKSAWPDGFVRIVSRWIVKRAGIQWPYEIDLPATGKYRRYRNSWHGRGWRHRQRSVMNRRNSCSFPYTIKDQRFQWSATHEVNNRLELWVYLIAHEAYHALPESRDRREPGSRKSQSRSSDEYKANEFANAAVAAFRVEWPKALKARTRRAIRADRDKAIRAKERKASARGPQTRLARAQANMANWERKAKRARTAIKKYRRQVRYYEGRVAAPPKGSP